MSSEVITSNDLKAILNKVLPQEPQDSGWQNASLSSSFTLYDSSASAKYRKIGNIVYVYGTVKPTTAIAGSDARTTIFTLPEGYRPPADLMKLCQGSSANKWLLSVLAANGTVSFSRYGTTAYAQAPTTAWLPFEISFAV